MTTTAICLFGTPGAELNLGVGALRDSVVQALQRERPDAKITVFDDGWGVRARETAGGTVTYCGGRDSRRLHRPESFLRMRAALPVGGWGNPGAQRLLQASAVFDVSGGDSFSDLYGTARFRTVAWPKILTLAAHRPLVLLPQTYGPFGHPQVRARATQLLRGATQVWARDRESKATADEMIGADTVLLGVDMALGLVPTPMTGRAGDAWTSWFDAQAEPVAGININGMLVNQVDAPERYGVSPHHAEEMAGVARAILGTSEWRVALVPHVVGEGGVDTDVEVCRAVAAALQEEFGTDRVFLADQCRTAGEAKWVISRCSWFTGARMHATIAALSSGVPTAGVAYSRKMGPIFDDLDQPIVDARTHRDRDLVDALVERWHDHDSARYRLANRLPHVKETWSRQISVMLSAAEQPPR